MIVGKRLGRADRAVDHCFTRARRRGHPHEFASSCSRNRTRAHRSHAGLGTRRHVTVSIDAILERVTPQTRVGSPTPTTTGSYIAHRKSSGCTQSCGNVILVLDAAYAEYVNRNGLCARVPPGRRSRESHHCCAPSPSCLRSRLAHRLGAMALPPSSMHEPRAWAVST